MTNFYYRLRYWVITAWCRCRGHSFGCLKDMREVVARWECDPHRRKALAAARKRFKERSRQIGERHA